MSLAVTAIAPTSREMACTGRLLRVASVDALADDVVQVRFEDPEGGDLAPWHPGDHLEIVLPSSLIRHYSLCGDPDDRSSYTVAVFRVADGRGGSREIHDSALVGADLLVRGPRNNFTLVEAPSYLLLAGGIGITPIYAMARHLQRNGADWSLVYGARSCRAMAFREETVGLGADRVQLVLQDEQGLPDFAAALDAATPGTAVYCCGPEPMIALVEQLCAERSDRLALHVERFRGNGTLPETLEGDQPFELELAETGVVLHVPADRTALEIVHEMLPDHPYSCLAGQCGSCEVAVLAGEVDWRDEVLTDEEHETSSAMMLCVSRARSQRLVIEL
jgi:tetrachlorobenzoquinone reductase